MMRAGSHALGLVPALLVAIVLGACMSAPQKPEAQAAAPPADPDAAAAGAAASGNPYPGMTLRIAPNGAKLYCRKEIATGERIAKERCYTEQAMRQMDDQRQDFEKTRETSAYGTGGV
ncbi:MAG: hypothetical protein KF822_04585 [Steroidobacteraceae bacterium]|nr:hypothetical protein [Steroidobacteraceae bacterium]